MARNNHVVDTFKSMGYEEIDGGIRLKSMVGTFKVVNFHRWSNPLLYQDFHNTDDLVEKEEIKEATPTLTKDDYISVSMLLFSETIEDLGWYMKMAGPRICFYEPVGETFFVVSNNYLQLHLVNAAKKLGVPNKYTIMLSFAKALMNNLKHIVAIEEMDRNDDFE